MTWHEAIVRALRRMLVRHPNRLITLAELKQTELRQIVSDTRSQAREPWHSLERECQDLRDEGILEFIDGQGTYRVTKKL